MIEFKQGENRANELRWILVLVSSVDGVTGLTGQTGQVQLSVNGGTPTASTNNIVEVDSVNMPGHYYIQLAPSEVQTLGQLSLYYKSAGSLAFHDRGIVTYNDPYAAQGGIMVSSGSSGSGFTKTIATSLLKDIRKIVKEEVAAIELGEDDVELIPAVDYTPHFEQVFSALDELKGKEFPELELSPVLDAINSIEKPVDYTPHIKAMSDKFDTINPTFENFSKTSNDFNGKMTVAADSINSSLETVKTISEGFAELQKMMDEFKQSFDSQLDMDKRFMNVNKKLKDDNSNETAKAIQQLHIKMINMQHDLAQRILDLKQI